MIDKYIGTLIALEAIDRLSSFTAAAKELGVSQSAISMKVVRLEREMNMKLVQRTTRSVYLSPEGKTLVQLSSAAIKEIESVLVGFKHHQEEGALMVECLSSIASKWLIPRLGKFHKKCPDISVQITIQDDQSEPIGPNVDVAIRIASSPISGTYSHFLTPESFFPVCSPSLLHDISTLSICEALNAYSILEDRMALHDGSGCNWSNWMKEMGIDEDKIEKPPILFDRADLAHQAAIAGQGLAMGRAFISIDDINHGVLIAPFDQVKKLKWSYYFVSRAK